MSEVLTTSSPGDLERTIEESDKAAARRTDASSGLAKYLTQTKPQPGSGRGEAEIRVESILSELDVPWSAEPEGDVWKIQSDVGLVFVGLDDADEVLSLWQLIAPINRRRGKTDFYASLLKSNSQTRGACLALTDLGDGQETVVVIGRVAATDIGKEQVALVLGDLFEYSKMFDAPE
jgi:hypothetical protein